MDLIDLKTNGERWRYPRFFSDAVDAVGEESAFLSPADARHAEKVLRFNKGDKAVICDGKGMDYLCAYIGNGRFEVLERFPNNAEPAVKLRLFQCCPKLDKMDFIVQKAVELGASEIIPVIAARCISRPTANSAAGKVARWNKIAYEAAKQCGRGRVPSVGGVVNFQQALDMVNPANLGIIFYECGGQPLGKVLGVPVSASIAHIDLFIGSEGGFEAAEVELAKSRGLVPATMGERILRVDTAAVSAISIVMYLVDNG